MYQTDWLLRQIEQMGDVMRRLIAALREHRPADAIQLTREAVGELLDTDPTLVDVLTGDGLVTLLSAGGPVDAFRAHMLAELLMARADAFGQLGQAADAARERQRAAALLQAAAPHVEGAQAERVAELLRWLRAEELAHEQP